MIFSKCYKQTILWSATGALELVIGIKLTSKASYRTAETLFGIVVVVAT